MYHRVLDFNGAAETTSASIVCSSKNAFHLSAPAQMTLSAAFTFTNLHCSNTHIQRSSSIPANFCNDNHIYNSIPANNNSGFSRGQSLTLIVSIALVVLKKDGEVCRVVVFMTVLCCLDCSMRRCENLTVSWIYGIDWIRKFSQRSTEWCRCYWWLWW